MENTLEIPVDDYSVKQCEFAPKSILTIPNPNWEYLIHQCPSDIIESELRKRFKDSKMSSVLVLEPIAGSPEITFDFSIRREEDL